MIGVLSTTSGPHHRAVRPTRSWQAGNSVARDPLRWIASRQRLLDVGRVRRLKADQADDVALAVADDPCHSTVPASPSESSAWVKIMCGSASMATPSARSCSIRCCKRTRHIPVKVKRPPPRTNSRPKSHPELPPEGWPGTSLWMSVTYPPARDLATG